MLFLTMELLAGETLVAADRAAGRSPPAEALPLVAQMAAGLDAAHAAGVVHRDFKSDNVMLVPPRAARPGARGGHRLRPGARRRGDEAVRSISDTGVVVGTPAYMAPEQVQGRRLTPAADVYALGVVMYEMVTGEPPLRPATRRWRRRASA